MEAHNRVWARNGRELFYRDGDRLMTVKVESSPDFRAGTPTMLFERAYFAPPRGLAGRAYDVSADGQRFLMLKDVISADPASSQARIVLVQNWFEELKPLVPTK